jgi:hypothetical protein
MRQAVVAALFAIFVSGCYIPVPRSQNVARVPGILRQRPKLDGVVEGITTRHELEQILPGFSTNPSDRDFLGARWEDPADPFACGADPIDANRDWKNVNVLAISDASGILKRYRVCSDRDLGGCLTFMADNVVSPPVADTPRICSRQAHRLGDGRQLRTVNWLSRISFSTGNRQRKRSPSGVTSHASAPPRLVPLRLFEANNICGMPNSNPEVLDLTSTAIIPPSGVK